MDATLVVQILSLTLIVLSIIEAVYLVGSGSLDWKLMAFPMTFIILLGVFLTQRIIFKTTGFDLFFETGIVNEVSVFLQLLAALTAAVAMGFSIINRRMNGKE